MRNLVSLEDIAKANNGNRAFGFSGFDASRDFILSEVSKFDTATAWKENFTALFTQVTSINFRVGAKNYSINSLTYSPSTSAEGITAPLVHAPSGNVSCTAAAYANLDVKDKIVLIERGLCPDNTTFAGRIRPAAAAGAVAVIIYNNEPANITGGTLTNPDPKGYVPAGLIQQVDGLALAATLKEYPTTTAYFQQTQLIAERITQNVFAETKGGDPSNVIMLGAHLDSVQAGPGINDDGSGSTLILELFKAIQKYKIKNKIRFAWWGAEENGKLGSKAYTAKLNATEIHNLLVYLNFDMVARGYFGVFDSDGSTHGTKAPPGSEIVEQLFIEALHGKGLNVTAAKFTGGSDYAPFMDLLKKPIGGLHTGTEFAQDPCYHQKCDTVDNINSFVLTTNAKVTARVLSILAAEGENLIPKAPLNATSKVKRLARSGVQVELRGSPCGGHEY
ncbi:Zn-dependent exopeptidase [Tothia fuscella]|uniref:Peptide hydrolase n=1 Tax=Tothia fuscella TaxID=1048955 RepID=A0A9P4NI16_9PEZI|nr:Zn-dependent exopeptidase [Tothia fuscella]